MPSCVPPLSLGSTRITTHKTMFFSRLVTISAILQLINAQEYFNSTSAAKVTEVGTTVITVTSCSHSSCSSAAITTGVTVVTETVEGMVTVYTTYCPLATESGVSPHSSAPESSAPSPRSSAPAAKSSAPHPSATTSARPAATTAVVSTFHGNAARVASGSMLGFACVALLL